MDSKTLEWLNSLDQEEAELSFLRCCGSTKFAAKVAAARPFASSAHLIQVIDETWSKEVDVVGVLEAFAAHPRIGEKPSTGQPSAATARWCEGEQAAAQSSATAEISQELAEWNAKYESKFGHVFLICASGRRSDEILAELKARYSNGPLVELQVAAAEQHKITKLRLAKLLAPVAAAGAPESPPVDSSAPAASSGGAPLGPLGISRPPTLSAVSAAAAASTTSPAATPPLRPPITTHVLDIALGRPAAGIPVSLEILKEFAPLSTPTAKWQTIGASVTDADGRSGPLMEPSDVLPSGTYRLTFATGDYRRDSFYPHVAIVFEVRAEQTRQHFHVPLLLSPFGYSTYRGS